MKFANLEIIKKSKFECAKIFTRLKMGIMEIYFQSANKQNPTLKVVIEMINVNSVTIIQYI